MVDFETTVIDNRLKATLADVSGLPSCVNLAARDVWHLRDIGLIFISFRQGLVSNEKGAEEEAGSEVHMISKIYCSLQTDFDTWSNVKFDLISQIVHTSMRRSTCLLFLFAS